LRFPGFEGEWIRVKLENIAEKVNSGKTPLGGESTYLTDGVVFIRSQNVNNNRLELENPVFISDAVNNGMKNSIVKANDILLNITGASLGRSCVVPNGFKLGNVNQHVCIIRLKKESDPRFIQPILSSAKGQSIFESLQTGSGREGLNFESIKKIELDLPLVAEQVKIANFLSLIDLRIKTQNKIIEQLKTLIQEIGDKIFEQKIKLKRYNDVWAVKSLGSIGKTFNGLTGKNKENFGKGKPYIQYKQIFDSSKVQIEHCGLIEITENENQSLVMYGDIFFTISSETPGEIGMSSVLLDEVNEMYLNSFCFGYRPKSLQIINPLFARFFFRSSVFRNEVVKLAQGSTRYNMSKFELMKLNVSLPSFEEQIIISNFLSSINKRIEVENNILERYKSQKQYLLQNLFI
jgi:type I restriction enzyme S subunit